ncbi:cadherin-like domain-containing protein, partial [Ancylothrix sp. C2]|uniref:cadherin-like domain-containing protein n=1 Tax=Ancylothrix sp. D3o TaxID=2953691 RepID=UPI0021BAB702
DGVINNSDLELLNQNLGFVANTPAVITPSNILTHQELETTIDLGKFVSDADNDALAYSISNPVNGTLETLNDGQTVVFKPASNFAGVGSFKISVDDGGYEVSETININVSDAPLINLEIIKSKKQLNVGETISLEVQGDFADAEDVVLPDSYLTYGTENAEIAQISASGDVTASSEGTTILSVKRNNISAVTAVRAGQLKTPQNQGELNVAIAELYGLDSYPDAVTLPVGGTRQLLVGLNEVQESPDLKPAASGTRYFVSDSNILNVSVDGQITALKEGFATVTIVHGAAEEIIPVRVGTEVTGPATVGADGGIVKADDGSAVMIAPGALDANTTVSLTALNQAQLSLPIPEG